MRVWVIRGAQDRYTGMTKVCIDLSGMLNGTWTGMLTHCVLSACHEPGRCKSWGLLRGPDFKLNTKAPEGSQASVVLSEFLSFQQLTYQDGVFWG